MTSLSSSKDPLLTETVDGRYLVKQLLGSGGVGRVYRADDLHQGREVAIKLLRDELLDDDAARLDFQYEFQRLSRLSHPNILGAHNQGLWGRRSYFTMELVNGIALGKTTDHREQLLPLLVQLFSALAYLHGRQFVHRDIKPGNIHVTADFVGGLSLKMMDFGLLVPTGTHLHGQISGTPHYMAPEAVAGQRVDHRTDLYGLGVVIYRWCSGHFPRAAVRSGSRISVDWSIPVVPLQNMISTAFCDLVMELLDPNPAGRPARTVDALQRLRDIAGMGNEELSAETVPPLLSLDMVGRKRQLSQLRGIRSQNSELDSVGAVAIVGESGVGKTRLLEQWILESMSKGRRVLSVALDRHAGYPYRALQRLLASSGGASTFIRELSDLAKSAAGDPMLHDRARVVELLAERIAEWLKSDRVGDQAVILAVDDLHWSDEASLEVLRRLAEPPQGVVSLVFTAASSATLHPSSGLRQLLSEAEQLPLGNLDSDDLRRMLQAIFGEFPLPNPFVSWLMHHSLGNPRTVEELLGQLVDQNRIRHADGRWYIPLKGWQEYSAPDSDAPLLELPTGDALPIAEALAVSAPVPLSLQGLLRLAELEEARFLPALQQLVDQRRVTTVAQDLAFRDPRWAEATYRSIPEARRRILHRRCASWLAERRPEASASSDASDGLLAAYLGYHYSRGDEPIRALPFLMTAGRDAYENHALVDAIGPLQDAEAILSQHDPGSAQRGEIWEMLARIGSVHDPELARENFTKLHRELQRHPVIRRTRRLRKRLPTWLALPLVFAFQLLLDLLRLRRPSVKSVIKPIQDFAVASAFLGSTDAIQGRFESAASYAEGILDFAVDARHIPWAAYQVVHGLILLGQGRFAELAPLRRAIEIYQTDRTTPIEPVDRLAGQASCDMTLGFGALLSGAGDFDLALSGLRELCEREQTDYVWGFRYQLEHAAAAVEGRWSEAMLVQEKVFRHVKRGAVYWPFVNVNLMFAAINHYQAGMFAEAEMVIVELEQAGYGEVYREGWSRFHRGTVLGLRGKPGDALGYLRQALAWSQRQEYYSAHLAALCHVEMVRQYVALGEPQAAESHLQIVEAMALQPSTRNEYLLTHCELLRGELELSRGRQDQALRFFAAAARRGQALARPNRYLIAQGRLGMLRAAPDLSKALSEQLAETQALVLEMGNHRLSRELYRLILLGDKRELLDESLEQSVETLVEQQGPREPPEALVERVALAMERASGPRQRAHVMLTELSIIISAASIAYIQRGQYGLRCAFQIGSAPEGSAAELSVAAALRARPHNMAPLLSGVRLGLPLWTERDGEAIFSGAVVITPNRSISVDQVNAAEDLVRASSPFLLSSNEGLH